MNTKRHKALGLLVAGATIAIPHRPAAAAAVCGEPISSISEPVSQVTLDCPANPNRRRLSFVIASTRQRVELDTISAPGNGGESVSLLFLDGVFMASSLATGRSAVGVASRALLSARVDTLQRLGGATQAAVDLLATPRGANIATTGSCSPVAKGISCGNLRNVGRLLCATYASAYTLLGVLGPQGRVARVGFIAVAASTAVDCLLMDMLLEECARTCVCDCTCDHPPPPGPAPPPPPKPHPPVVIVPLPPFPEQDGGAEDGGARPDGGPSAPPGGCSRPCNVTNPDLPLCPGTSQCNLLTGCCE